MNKEIFQKILTDQRELSSLPQVVAEVIRVSGSSDTSAADLAEVVMKDPGLTAKLLRVVNSPYYAPASKISTVKQAVVNLGVRTVTAVTVATSIYSLIGSVHTTIDRKKFWRHSLEVALASRMIARSVKLESPDEAFVAGLLHDIGMLVMEASFPEDFGKVWKKIESGDNLIEAEQEIWGTNHARVGQFLLAQWNIPENICQAVGNHHQVFAEEDEKKGVPLDNVVNLANLISKFRINSMTPPGPKFLESKRIMAAGLDISNSALAEIEKNLISDVVRESGFLEIDIGNMEEILREANRLLYKQYLIAEDLLRQNMDIQQQMAEGHAVDNSGHMVRELIERFSLFINDVNQAMLALSQEAESVSMNGEIQSAAERLKEIIGEGTGNISYILEELKRINGSGHCRNNSLLGEAEQRINLRIQKFRRSFSPIKI
nr:HDOD domain-containing protein [candidate division Zixibacteria bacterium]